MEGPLLSNAICEHATQRLQMLDSTDHVRSRLTTEPEAMVLNMVQSQWIGELTGLKIALCLHYGWDPEEKAGHEGPAARMITSYRANTRGEDYLIPSPGVDTLQRCPSCDHLYSVHNEASCWYSITLTTTNHLVTCPCAMSKPAAGNTTR